MQNVPLLVTGLPRCGTSWTGKMLEASGQVVYINEPMSVRRPPGGSLGVLNSEVTHHFQYIDPLDDERWRNAFRDTLRLRFRPIRELRSIRRPYQAARAIKYAGAFGVGSLRGRRAMLDDPNALFSARWLTEVMGVRTIFLVRDPVGMIGSWRQLGWQPKLQTLLAQPPLVRDHLTDMRADIEMGITRGDWIDQMCCLWNVGNRYIDTVRTEVGGVHVWRYEDLANEPMTQFEALYGSCGLNWTPRARASIEQATSAPVDNNRAFSWSIRGGISRTAFRRMDSRASINRSDQRLKPDEVERVRELTADVLQRFPRTTV